MIKKIISILTSAILLIGTTGCYPHEAWLENNDEQKVADKLMQNIVTALENKDSKAIKAMFSEKAKEEAVNLDEGINYLINYYQGKMFSFKGVIESEENLNNGDKKLTIIGRYDVGTDKEKYYCILKIVSNTADDSENGLYSVQLLKKSKKDESMYWIKKRSICSGVLLPSMLKSENYLIGIVQILGNQDKETLKLLFSSNAIGKAVDFDDNVTKANDLFQGHMTSSKEIETSVENEGDNVVTKGYYEVTTSDLETEEIVGTYLVYFVHKRNETDPDEDGLYTLEVEISYSSARLRMVRPSSR